MIRKNNLVCGGCDTIHLSTDQTKDVNVREETHVGQKHDNKGNATSDKRPKNIIVHSLWIPIHEILKKKKMIPKCKAGDLQIKNAIEGIPTLWQCGTPISGIPLSQSIPNSNLNAQLGYFDVPQHQFDLK